VGGGVPAVERHRCLADAIRHDHAHDLVSLSHRGFSRTAQADAASAGDPGSHLTSFELEISPEAHVDWSHDVAGNAVATAQFDR
jgi:hypothetical protein